jgi:hypothetical protein
MSPFSLYSRLTTVHGSPDPLLLRHDWHSSGIIDVGLPSMSILLFEKIARHAPCACAHVKRRPPRMRACRRRVNVVHYSRESPVFRLTMDGRSRMDLTVHSIQCDTIPSDRPTRPHGIYYRGRNWFLIRRRDPPSCHRGTTLEL